MGSGYNTSLAVGRSTRGKASVRTPIHFYLDVPVYEYELECGHWFHSRTPISAYADEHERSMVWCDKCHDYRIPSPEPNNQPVSNDEVIAFEQDKGIIRERIARSLLSDGLLETDTELSDAVKEFGIPIREVRRINAGLTAQTGTSGQPEMCRAGLHELTPENLIFRHGRRACRQCDLIAQRNRRAAKRKIK